ncbi:hypothetical protein QBC34DRAFT_334387 [Podospora aff. communis PSN243]|uniref:NACHT domain-containing protein n=1 Tax=Podospora aff. communis PSN243 TaxID=3040156 RepID=A0AAV9GC23_9PEZI|nr:hypothetical protein QBC34DRAFT_334387 [Podospora aff. communis PSN243]
MEVVGVVAAVPELLKLAKRLCTAIGHISSKSMVTKAASGLRTQLELLSKVLESIQQRDGNKSNGRGYADCLTAILDDTRKELEELGLLVDRIEDAKNNGPKLLQRARLVFTGFESQLKARSQRIDRSVNLLQVYLTESAARAQLEAQLPGTLQWIWTHDAFLRWQGSNGTPQAQGSTSTQATDRAHNVAARVLLLYGVSGCGKSVLTASIANGLREKGATAFFFPFWASHSHGTSSESMFRTLLWQLLQQTPDDQQMKHMTHLLNNEGELRSGCSTETLINHIEQVGVKRGRELYLIIDGIDESSDDWNDIRDGPLGRVSKLVQSLPQLRVLLSGRQASLRTARRIWRQHIELTPDLVKEDMKAYIQHELDNCPEIHDEAVKTRIRMELESKSTVMFLWVKLVFKELRLSFSEAEIRQTLCRLPDQLGQEYHRIFNMVAKRLQGRQKSPSVGMQRAKDILTLMLGAARPLTMTELRLAYAYSSELSSSDKCYNERTITEEGVIDACGDIITVRGEFVFLAHSSLREFLFRQPDEVDHDGGHPPAEYFRLDAGSCQKVMALACLWYLQDIPWCGPGREHSPAGKDLEALHPFLSYATSYLPSHFLNSNMDTQEVQSHTESFLQSEEALCWFEFIMFLENDATRQATLPPRFWDEMVDFSVSHGGGPFDPDELSSDNSGMEENVMAGRGDGPVDGLPCLTDLHAVSYRNSNPVPIASSAATTTSPANTLLHPAATEGAAVSTLLQTLFLRNKWSSSQYLAVLLRSVKTRVIKVDALSNPLDIAAQALRGMSFLPLVLLAGSLQKTKPEHSLRLALLALNRVRGKGDLREALASGLVGDLQPDDGAAASHYQRSLEILESRPPNPLINMWSLNASSLQAHRLLDAGRILEARELMITVEAKLSATGESGEGSTLRRKTYKMFDKSHFFVRNRLSRTVNLGCSYGEHRLHREAERLLAPLAQDPVSLKLLGGEDAARTLDCLARAAFAAGKMDASADYWRRKLEILVPTSSSAGEDAQTIQEEMDFCRFCLAESLAAGGRMALARKELASLTSFAYLIHDPQDFVEFTMRFYIHVTHIMDELAASSRKQAALFLEENIKYLEEAFKQQGGQTQEVWRLVTRQLLAQGNFDAAETYIRWILADTTIPGHTDSSKEQLIYALEALAFSTRHRSLHPKRRDPYDYYLTVRDITRKLEYHDEWLDLRREMGFGFHCAATGRQAEAAQAFTAVADGYEKAKCGPLCFWESAEMLFRAMAAMESKKTTESIFLFSTIIHCLESGALGIFCCDLRVQFQPRLEKVLLVVANFYLASLFDECGLDAAVGNSFRDCALMTIKDSFKQQRIERDTYRGLLELDVIYVERWVRSCVSYVEKRKSGDIGSTVRAPEFPFELFLVPGRTDDYDVLGLEEDEDWSSDSDTDSSVYED